MSGTEKTLLVCNCNHTMKLDGRALGKAVGDEPLPIASELCRKHVAAFQAAAKAGGDLVVACTQEAQLFSDLHGEMQATGALRFVNIRESAGWSKEGAQAGPKIAALLAAARLPEPEAVPAVSYASAGELLIVGEAGPALSWAERLKDALSVTVLVTGGTADARLPVERAYPVHSGSEVQLKGYLGAFDASWVQANPIDLDLCTRCNACIRACPEGAIDFRYQVDLDRCRSHRACVAACGTVGAIDFAREVQARSERFDLVLDLARDPLIRLHEPPQGYAAPGRDPLEQALAAKALVALVGEFEKPKFFAYREKLCAHSRNEIVGCRACVDVCSTGAIASDVENNRVVVEPHLCMGCGGCATVCPSGAMSYAYPRVSDMGARIRTLLKTYGEAGGKDASLLFHNAADGRALIAELGRSGDGLPARVVPLETLHVAAIGIDLLLAGIALGAAQCIVLATGTEAPEYVAALRAQMRVAGNILEGLGYGADRLALLEAPESEAAQRLLWSLPRPRALPSAATFHPFDDKRTTLDFALDHLWRHAPAQAEVVALPKGAPYGQVEVDTTRCTLCMSCVGACPENALLDSKEAPELRFVEHNCVQCGLCERTCPESAIALVPRLLFGAGAREARTLNRAEPFCCVRCAKPFGTRQMVEVMMKRLSLHSMFASPQAQRRLQMCADCRVVDMMENREELSVHDVTRNGPGGQG